MTSELVSVTFLIHVPLRSALKREAYRRDVSFSEAARRAMYAGMTQPEWGTYRRDSVVEVEEARSAD